MKQAGRKARPQTIAALIDVVAAALRTITREDIRGWFMRCGYYTDSSTAPGMGNGAVFELVPQRFPKELGVITGIVGAACGIGGYYLNMLLGLLGKAMGSLVGGFLLFGLLSGLCAGFIVYVSRSWERAFVGQGGLAQDCS